ncbi:MAG: sigma-70 family RNA polymerase sigma factor [Planctomycetes bacterium]|nr:sigma-70 family RNA polymerase sigma factor [Planctomycetota bacterium]
MNEDREDFEGRLLSEGRALRGLARALAGAGGGDDDLLQETTLQALAARERAGSHLPQWLRVTMKNLSRTMRRGGLRREAREREVAGAEEAADADPAQLAIGAEVARDVAAAVHALDEPFRTVVMLRFWHGLLPEAIAERLGVPRNTVRSRLQRGLERLRQRLDVRHGDRQRWSAPLLLVTGMRLQPAAATASVGAAAFSTGIGVLMNVKLMLGVAVVAAVTLLAMWRPEETEARVETVKVDDVQAAAAAQLPEGLPRDMERELVAAMSRRRVNEPVADQPVVDPEVPIVDPWPVRLLIVDEAGKPVPDAEVVVWARRYDGVRKSPIGGDYKAYTARAAGPLQRLRTDPTGRVSVVVDREVFEVEAVKEGSSDSDPATFWAERAPQDEQRLVLLTPVFLSGRVLLEDGRPAVGATVTTKVDAGTTWYENSMTVPTVAPQRTDAQGAFRVPVRTGLGYTMSAQLDGRETFAEQVWCFGRAPDEVTLRFTGSAAIAGTVVDGEGRVVPHATVTAWRVLDVQTDQDLPRIAPRVEPAETVTVEADEQGRFRIDVRRARPFDVLAQGEGRATSPLVRVELSAVRPRGDVQLVMPEFATIRGRVVDETGDPVVGVPIVAKPETGLDLGMSAVDKGSMPSQLDLFPKVKAPRTAADGSFAMQVHPGTTWRLSVRLSATNWRLAAVFPGILAGGDDVVLTVREQDRAGCVPCGMVTSADGQRHRYEIQIVDLDEKVGGSLAATWTGDSFACEPIGLGRNFLLRIEQVDGDAASRTLAPMVVGPLTADRARHEVAVRMQPFGTLPVRVVGPAGAAIGKVHLLATPLPRDRYSFVPAPRQGDSAERSVTVELTRLIPGPNEILAGRAIDGTMQTREVTVRPGPNPELLIELPAK